MEIRALPTHRDRGSKKRLRPGAARHYPHDTNFDRLARAVCEAQCLPRKELYESWEMAKRVRRHLRGTRVIDLACGHGLLAHMLAVLFPGIDQVLGMDRALPPSASRLARALQAEWPALERRVTLREQALDAVSLRADDLVVCAHGCGALTDQVLRMASEVGADVAVLPCCQDHSHLSFPGLQGWLSPDLAIDVVRAWRLREQGYRVRTQHIPADITPKNRLLLGRRTPSPPG